MRAKCLEGLLLFAWCLPLFWAASLLSAFGIFKIHLAYPPGWLPMSSGEMLAMSVSTLPGDPDIPVELKAAVALRSEVGLTRVASAQKSEFKNQSGLTTYSLSPQNPFRQNPSTSEKDVPNHTMLHRPK